MGWEQNAQLKLSSTTSPKIIANMQPTYLPWCGYFDLMDQVDEFILLDTVGFSKRSYQQRNRIRTQQGLIWLTIPVISKGERGQPLKDVIFSDRGFFAKHLRTIELNYKKAPFFDKYHQDLSKIYKGEFSSVTDFTITLITWIRDQLGIDTPLVKASSLENLEPQEKVGYHLDICRHREAITYLSPQGSKEYLEQAPGAFEDAGIQLRYQHYEHPEYKQLHEPFMPYATILDLLLIKGPEAIRIMRSGRI